MVGAFFLHVATQPEGRRDAFWLVLPTGPLGGGFDFVVPREVWLAPSVPADVTVPPAAGG